MNDIVKYNERLHKQSRFWFVILYPDDNESHHIALEISKEMFNTVIMYHHRSMNPDMTPKKPHYHVCFRWENGYYLSKLISDLRLSGDDAHLFKTLSEIRFKKFDDYIIYLTHKNCKDKEIYNENLFLGGLRNYAIKLCSNLSKSDYEMMNEIIKYLESWHKNDPYFSSYSYSEIYMKLNDKYGFIVYKKWHMIKDFLRDYKYSY